MKLGTRTYNKQEIALVEVYKNHIQFLQKEIDEHWDMLLKQVSDGKKQHDDYLWDYVMNDFHLEK
jgi:hypothetical protein